MSRYHKAAIDGYLDLLKEATRKDLNSPDEDGMTPTLWAAFHGQVDALQLICSRGGDPDRSDIWGNTPLHHASANGHMHILSFLVNFGANLFALDNEFHSAMDVAASRDRMACVRFLDDAASRQATQNAKKVARLKQAAAREAERRVKLCEKVQKRHQSKMDKMYSGGAGGGGSASDSGRASLSRASTLNGVNEQFSKLIASDASGSLTARLKGTLQGRFGKKSRAAAATETGDGNVIFVKQENGAAAGAEPEFTGVFGERGESDGDGGGRMRGFEEEEEEEEDEDGGDWSNRAEESIFKRPGLGNMVFRKNFSMEAGVEPEDFPSRGAEDFLFLKKATEADGGDGDGDGDDGFGDGDLPWNREELGLDDEEDEETSPLDAFLSAIALPDFAPAFEREQLDLEALMLCSDDDLKSVRIQLGPRKKILEAAARRRSALQTPGVMKDSFL